MKTLDAQLKDLQTILEQLTTALAMMVEVAKDMQDRIARLEQAGKS